MIRASELPRVVGLVDDVARISPVLRLGTGWPPAFPPGAARTSSHGARQGLEPCSGTNVPRSPGSTAGAGHAPGPAVRGATPAEPPTGTDAEGGIRRRVGNGQWR